MRSFHHSRPRVFFEVLCAFGIAASCVGAWMQTGATAMLAAAGIAAFYGLVHAFDMVRPKPAALVPAGTVEPVIEQTAGVAVDVETIDQVEMPANPVAKPEPAAPVAAAPKPRAKAARKPRTKAPKAVKAAEQLATDEPVVLDEPSVPGQPVAVEESNEIVMAPQEGEAESSSQQAEEATPIPDDAHQAPVVPLFEADPFVRQQRAVFGRKAG